MMARLRTQTTRILACLTLGLCGCPPQPDNGRLNSPPIGDSHKKPYWSSYFAYHNDQGMLADMCIADIHFVPHTATLSGIGQARLERYAELLATSGGQIHYDPQINDERLIEARLATAQEFLGHALPGSGRVEVDTGLPGGRGLPSRESIAGMAVARQPEPRAPAYHLNVRGASSGS